MLEYLVDHPAAKQMPAAAMNSLIMAALYREAPGGRIIRYSGEGVLRLLCKAAARATEQLDAAAGLQLLQTAVQLRLCYKRDGCGLVSAVCSLPAVKQLDLAAVEPLMQQAARAEEGEFGHSSILSELSRLPAAQQLSSASMHQLLQSAVQRGCHDIVHNLLRHPAARRLKPAAAADVLRAAVATRSSENRIVSVMTNTAFFLGC